MKGRLIIPRSCSGSNFIGGNWIKCNQLTNRAGADSNNQRTGLCFLATRAYNFLVLLHKNRTLSSIKYHALSYSSVFGPSLFRASGICKARSSYINEGVTTRIKLRASTSQLNSFMVVGYHTCQNFKSARGLHKSFHQAKKIGLRYV